MYLEIGRSRLCDPIGLNRTLYEQTPATDVGRLNSILLESPLGEITGLALAGGLSFGDAMQALGEEHLFEIRENTRRWSAQLTAARQ